jgi:hypothetical protein
VLVLAMFSERLSVITEEGRFLAEEIAALVDRTPFLREGYALLRNA